MLTRLLLLPVALSSALFGCQSRLSAGEWACDSDGSAGSPALTDPLAVPWSTGFEDRFCDYTQRNGICLGGDDSFIVSDPVHSGRYAAAFRVDTDDPDTRQSRCFTQGSLPTTAHYGAWYFIPAAADADRNLWNLWHFQGSDEPGPLHSLWDVTLVNSADGSLELVAYSELVGRVFRATTPRPVPLGSWFHIELFLKRARDATGRVALYQDGVLVFEAADLITDDSTFAQWYVGNLATGLIPPTSTLYVDDISIRAGE